MLKIILRSIAFTACIIASAPAFADKPAPAAVRTLIAQFKSTMMDCPDRIWAGFSWKGLNLVLIYPSESHAWVWNASTASLKRIPLSELPSSAAGSLFEFFELGGAPSMSLNMEEANFERFQLGVHEFFHYQGQKDWRGRAGNRGTFYPLAWQPRFYRRMIFDRLRSHFTTGATSDLAKARYWFDKWSTEYPHETQSTTDGYEGTAEYVEILAAAVGKLGCGADDAQIKKQLLPHIHDKKYGLSLSGQYLSLDLEGYTIGGLAALTLRFREADLGAWNGKIAANATPLEILMEGVQPEPESAPAELESLFQASARNSDHAMGALLDADIARWQDKDYVRVALRNDWLQSNIRPEFFAFSEKLQLPLFPVRVAHPFRSSDGSSELELKARAVTFDYATSPCGSGWFALVPEKAIHISKGVAQVSAPALTGRISGARLKSDAQGFRYLCE
jgi:hypothetical protein